MTYSQLFYSLLILFSYISMAFSHDEFAQFEEELLLKHTILEKTPDKIENEKYLKLNRDGVKVYVYSNKHSNFKIFKASTHINTTLDSILAVMLDNDSGIMWIDACEKSFIIKNISFNERYHYHVFNIPFPFNNRDFIFHSTFKQNPIDKSVIIKMHSVSNYCNDKQSIQCDEVNQSEHVRVNQSNAAFKLVPDVNGIKITWIQDTNPGGNLPSWLVNQLVENTPFRTFKNLAEIVKDDKYKNAKLIYNNNGIAFALQSP